MQRYLQSGEVFMELGWMKQLTDREADAASLARPLPAWQCSTTSIPHHAAGRLNPARHMDQSATDVSAGAAGAATGPATVQPTVDIRVEIKHANATIEEHLPESVGAAVQIGHHMTKSVHIIVFASTVAGFCQTRLIRLERAPRLATLMLSNAVERSGQRSWHGRGLCDATQKTPYGPNICRTIHRY
jgi:hypothetical protein